MATQPQTPAPLHVVTGAFGYTGQAIAQRLLARGTPVRTLTNSRPFSPGHDPFPTGRVEVRPLNFHDEPALIDALRDPSNPGRGAAVLYNTYWVRFNYARHNHARFNFNDAVENTKRLFAAAKEAGVGRIVHVSILHAREADDLAYYRGKHELERELESLGVAHSIVRPGVLFGEVGVGTTCRKSDILINNIAWVLRRLPIFGVFGDGQYRLRPLHVSDMADLMIREGDRAPTAGNTITDAVGPESFAYIDLVRTLAEAIGVGSSDRGARRARWSSGRPIIRVAPLVGLGVGKLLNPIVGDVIITREEIAGLMRGLLDSNAPPPTPTAIRLSDWANTNATTLGQRYASEVGRRAR